MTVGLKIGDIPEVMYVPPHEPVYQFQIAPVPKLPPFNPNVVLFPGQIGVTPKAAVAGEELEFKVTVVFTHEVELHAPIALI